MFTNGVVNPYFWAVQSVSVLIMWWKLLYFFRTDKDLSWLVTLVIASLKKILPFLFVFAVMIMGFSISFLLHQIWITQVRLLCPKEFAEDGACYP